MSIESEAVKTVAGLMALAARTAPKAVGPDSISIEIITGKEQEKVGEKMIRIAGETGMDFFRTNGEQVKTSDATVLIGLRRENGLGLNCGACGYETCNGLAKACAAANACMPEYPVNGLIGPGLPEKGIDRRSVENTGPLRSKRSGPSNFAVMT
jgi:uncharacterized ferredoxin-like protein